MAALEVHSLSVERKGRRILRGVNLVVPERSLFCLLGNNGAGKSTTLRAIAGLLPLTSGSVHLFGHCLREHRVGALSRLGCVIDLPRLYPNLKACEFLSIATRLRRAKPADIRNLLEIVGLHDARGRIGAFSTGMRQRLSIAHALVGRPPLVILDEPMNGLDPAGTESMGEFLRSLPTLTGCTLLYTSHLLDDVDRMATHLAVLHDGRMLQQGEKRELLSGRPGVTFETDHEQMAVNVLAASGCPANTIVPGCVRVEGASREDVPRLIRLLVDAQVDVHGVTATARTSLREWYRMLTATEPRCD